MAALTPEEQDNEVKLDLAEAYEEMGDLDGAKELLREVRHDGNPSQRRQARAMLWRLRVESPEDPAADRDRAVAIVFARALVFPHEDAIGAALLFASERDCAVADAVGDAVHVARFEDGELARGLEAFVRAGLGAGVAALEAHRNKGIAAAAKAACAGAAEAPAQPRVPSGIAFRALGAYLADSQETLGFATLVRLCAHPADEEAFLTAMRQWPGTMPPALVRFLGTLEDPRTLDVLERQWRIGNGASFPALAEALARVPSASAAALLVRWLRDPNRFRKSAARAAIAPGNVEHRAAVLAACREDEAFAVEESGLLVQMHGAEGGALIVNALGSRFRHVREAAVGALSGAGGAGSEALATQLLDFLAAAQDVEVRACALAALGARPEAAALAALGDALASSDWEVRRAAAAALGRRSEIAALPLLARALGDPHPVVRLAVRGALDAFGGSDDDATLEGLLDLVAGDKPLSAECAATVLERMAAGAAGEKVNRALATRLQGASGLARDAWVAIRARLERVGTPDAAPAEDSAPDAAMLEDVAQRILKAPRLAAGLEAAVADICSLFGSARVTVYAVGGDLASLVALVQSGLGDFKPLKLPIECTSLAGHAAKTKATLNVADAYDKAALAKLDPQLRFLEEVDKRTGFRTRQVLVAPLLEPGTGTLRGVVQLLNHRGGTPFPPAAEIRLRRFCAAIASAFQPPKPRDLDEDDFSEANENDLVKLCNKLIVDAWEKGADKLHFRHVQGRGKTACDFTVGGRREPYIEIPSSYRRPLTLRYKLMCRRAPGETVSGIRSGDIRLGDFTSLEGIAKVEFFRGEADADDVVIHLPRVAPDSGEDSGDIGDMLSGIDNEDPPAASPAPVAARDSSPPAPTAAVPAPITDQVYFTVTAPRTVRAASPFVLDVWAHLEGDRGAVLARAAEEAAGGAVRAKTKGTAAIARGAQLGIRVRVPDFAFEDDDVLAWTGAAGNATFGIAVPKDVSVGVHLGTATFMVEGLQVSRLHFEIEVAEAEGPRTERTLRERRPRTAFASYASEDRDEVLARIQGMQKLLPDLDVFLDIVSIRSGEDWAKRLEHEIAQRDAFYLFWSAAASRSQWVEREWRAALRLKGLEAIDPVPLEPPQKAPPPGELGALHFNEWTLAYRGR